MTADQLKELEANLWQAADKLRVDSGLGWQYQPQMVGVVYNYRLQQKNKQQYNGSKEPMVRCKLQIPDLIRYEP